MEHKLFISYSHTDDGLVNKLAKFLSVADADIFKDNLSIKPGDKWHIAIVNAIENCDKFVIFWCRHSKASPHVLEEYELALEKDKTIVPVLLDNEPLISSLSIYQWEDFKDLGRPTHGDDFSHDKVTTQLIKKIDIDYDDGGQTSLQSTVLRVAEEVLEPVPEPGIRDIALGAAKLAYRIAYKKY